MRAKRSVSVSGTSLKRTPLYEKPTGSPRIAESANRNRSRRNWLIVTSIPQLYIMYISNVHLLQSLISRHIWARPA